MGEHRGRQREVGAGKAEGDGMRRLFLQGIAEDEFELPDLITAVEVRALIVPLDEEVLYPELLSEAGQPLDGGGICPEHDGREIGVVGDVGKPDRETRKCSEEWMCHGCLLLLRT